MCGGVEEWLSLGITALIFGWRRGGSVDIQAWFSNKKHLSGFDSFHRHGLVQIFESMKCITNNK